MSKFRLHVVSGACAALVGLCQPAVLPGETVVPDGFELEVIADGKGLSLPSPEFPAGVFEEEAAAHSDGAASAEAAAFVGYERETERRTERYRERLERFSRANFELDIFYHQPIRAQK